MPIGGSTDVGRLVTIQEDLPGDVDGILDAIRRIILMGEVRSIVVRDGEPLTYQRYVRPGETVKPSESTASFAELKPIDIVRQVPMEEYQETDGSDFYKQLIRMFTYVSLEGWVVTHLLFGDKTNFWNKLEIPPMISKRMTNFLGARVERDVTLQEDVFILCGAKARGATIAEIGFTLKGNIP
jgi:hypothetical protein